MYCPGLEDDIEGLEEKDGTAGPLAVIGQDLLTLGRHPVYILTVLGSALYVGKYPCYMASEQCRRPLDIVSYLQSSAMSLITWAKMQVVLRCRCKTVFAMFSNLYMTKPPHAGKVAGTGSFMTSRCNMCMKR